MFLSSFKGRELGSVGMCGSFQDAFSLGHVKVEKGRVSFFWEWGRMRKKKKCVLHRDSFWEYQELDWPLRTLQSPKWNLWSTKNGNQYAELVFPIYYQEEQGRALPHGHFYSTFSSVKQQISFHHLPHLWLSPKQWSALYQPRKKNADQQGVVLFALRFAALLPLTRQGVWKQLECITTWWHKVARLK